MANFNRKWTSWNSEIPWLRMFTCETESTTFYEMWFMDLLNAQIIAFSDGSNNCLLGVKVLHTYTSFSDFSTVEVPKYWSCTSVCVRSCDYTIKNSSFLLFYLKKCFWKFTSWKKPQSDMKIFYKVFVHLVTCILILGWPAGDCCICNQHTCLCIWKKRNGGGWDGGTLRMYMVTGFCCNIRDQVSIHLSSVFCNVWNFSFDF